MKNLLGIGLGFFSAWALSQGDPYQKGTMDYSPVGKRDPFKAPSVASMRDIANISPLERFSLEQFQLRAILKGKDGDRAMFEDPEGKTHVLVEGDVIGREKARISRIERRDLIVTERTENYLGVENLYEKVISLPPESDVDPNSMVTSAKPGSPQTQIPNLRRGPESIRPSPMPEAPRQETPPPVSPPGSSNIRTVPTLTPGGSGNP